MKSHALATKVVLARCQCCWPKRPWLSVGLLDPLFHVISLTHGLYKGMSFERLVGSVAARTIRCCGGRLGEKMVLQLGGKVALGV